MAKLYQTTKQNISLHIQNIYDEGELVEKSAVKEYLTTAADGKNYKVKHYNLDMIISVGYRIKSHIATRFRQWATQRLREAHFWLIPILFDHNHSALLQSASHNNS
jgi:hypothetical protein